MKKLLIVFVIFVGLTTSSSAKQTLDGSSREAFIKSVNGMQKTYESKAAQAAFAYAVLRLAMRKNSIMQGGKGFLTLQPAPEAVNNMHLILDGVTQSEIEEEMLKVKDELKKKDESYSIVLRDQIYKCWRFTSKTEDIRTTVQITFSEDGDIDGIFKKEAFGGSLEEQALAFRQIKNAIISCGIGGYRPKNKLANKKIIIGFDARQ